MSVQPPVAPHRVAIADIQIPFWRMVAIIIKWAIAAIPATIILTIIFTIIALVVGLIFGGIFSGLHIPGVKM